MPQHTDLDAVLGPAPNAYAQPEVVVLRVRRQGRRLVWPAIGLIVIAAGAGFWVGSLSETWMNIAAAAAAVVLALLLGIMPILAWLSHHATITSRRVILRHGVLVRHRSEVSFARMREVRSRRGPVQRMFGAGDIDMLVGAESVTLRDVPGVTLVADAMQELVERNYEHSTGSFGGTRVINNTAHFGEQVASGSAPGHSGTYPEEPVRFW